MLNYPTIQVTGLQEYYAKYSALSYGNGKIIALPMGEPRIAAISLDSEAKNWKHYGLPASMVGDWKNAAFGAPNWVAVNSSLQYFGAKNVGSGLYSSDGENWALSRMGSYGWNDIAYGNGRFVAVGEGSPANWAASTNGINWITGQLLNNGKWTSVVFGNGLFTAVSRHSKDNTLVAYSTNGQNWIVATVPSNIQSVYEKNQWIDVEFFNNNYYALAYNSTPEIIRSTNGANWGRFDITGNFEGSKIVFDGSNVIFLPYSGRNAIITSLAPGVNQSGIILENFDQNLLNTDFKWSNSLSNIPNINNLMVGYSTNPPKVLALTKNNIYCTLSGNSSIFTQLQFRSNSNCPNFWISGVTSNARLTGSVLGVYSPLSFNNPTYPNYYVIYSNGQVGNFTDGENILYYANPVSSTGPCNELTGAFPYTQGFRNNIRYRIKVINTNGSPYGTSLIAIGSDCQMLLPFNISSSSSSLPLIYDTTGRCSVLRWGAGDEVSWENSFNGFANTICYDLNYSYEGQVYWPKSQGILYISFDQATRIPAENTQQDEPHVRVKKAQFFVKNESLFYRYIDVFTGYGNNNIYLEGRGTGIILNPTGWQPAISYITGKQQGITNDEGLFNIDNLSINENNPITREEIVNGVAEIILEDLPCTGDCIENKLISEFYLDYVTGYTLASNTVEIDFSQIDIGDGFEIYNENTRGLLQTFIYSPEESVEFEVFSGIDQLVNKFNETSNFSGEKINSNSLKIISRTSGNNGRFFINRIINNSPYPIKIANRYSTGGEDLRPLASEISGDFQLQSEFQFENSGFYSNIIKITGDKTFSSNSPGTFWTNNFERTWTIITGIREQGDTVVQTGNVFYNNLLNQYIGTGKILSGDGLLIKYSGLKINFIRDNPTNYIGNNVAAYIISGKDIYFSGNLFA